MWILTSGIHQFHKYLVSTYYILGLILGAAFGRVRYLLQASASSAANENRILTPHGF